jgi:NADPH2:quinone reductase
MKAICISETGGPEVMHLEEVQEPDPGPLEVLVEVEVAGVNFIDTYHRQGLYPVELPFTPGIEAAGKVVRIGSEVEGVDVGESVVFCLSLGTYAERAVVEAWKLIRLPEGVDPGIGVTAMCQGMTAHYLVTDSYALKPGDTALVHAAAGGVGLLLVQMAKFFGATVFGTVSTQDKKRAALEAGADHVIIYDEEDFEETILARTEGQGVDVVYESVGKSTFEKSLDCLKPRGYLVLFGQASGPVPPLDPQILSQKGSLFLTRPTLGHYVADRNELEKRAADVLGWIQSGKLEVTIGRTFPLSQAVAAHQALEGRETSGKVLLTP